MYLPSLPDIGRLLARAAGAGAADAFAPIWSASPSGRSFYGPLSDRHRPPPVLLGALALYCVASLACALAPSIEMLIAARFLQAFGGAGAVVLARAVVRDLYDGARAGRELSLMACDHGARADRRAADRRRAADVLRLARRTSSRLLVFGVPRQLDGLAAAAGDAAAARAGAGVAVARCCASYRAFAGATAASSRYLGIVDAAAMPACSRGCRPPPSCCRTSTACRRSASAATFAVGSRRLSDRRPRSRRASSTRSGIDRTIGFGCRGHGGGRARDGAASCSRGCTAAPPLVLPMALYLAGLGLRAAAGAWPARCMPFPERAGAASSLLGLRAADSAAAVLGRRGRSHARPDRMAAGDRVVAAAGCLALALWCSLTARDPRGCSLQGDAADQRRPNSRSSSQLSRLRARPASARPALAGRRRRRRMFRGSGNARSRRPPDKPGSSATATP